MVAANRVARNYHVFIAYLNKCPCRRFRMKRCNHRHMSAYRWMCTSQCTYQYRSPYSRSSFRYMYLYSSYSYRSKCRYSRSSRRYRCLSRCPYSSPYRKSSRRCRTTGRNRSSRCRSLPRSPTSMSSCTRSRSGSSRELAPRGFRRQCSCCR